MSDIVPSPSQALPYLTFTSDRKFTGEETEAQRWTRVTWPLSGNIGIETEVSGRDGGMIQGTGFPQKVGSLLLFKRERERETDSMQLVESVRKGVSEMTSC